MTQNKHVSLVEERDIVIDKRVTMLQYINTGILSLILGLATMIAMQLSTIKSNQAATQAELVRLRTVQDRNVNDVNSLDKRVVVLELNYTQDLKNWVEDNFIRRPQGK